MSAEPIATITEDEAEDILYGGDVIATETISEHRWYDRQLIVFRDGDGPLRGFYYMKPATEEQEGQDRFESDPVKVYPVVAEVVSQTVYGVEKVGAEA